MKEQPMPKIFIKNRENLDLAILFSIPQEPSQGLVFIEHGFTGHKDEPQIKTIAETFVNKGYSVVLFDVSNSTGESGSNQSAANFTSYYNDLEDVILWSKTQEWYMEPFTLCGHSLGGLSAINYTANHSDAVKLLIPISPAINGEDLYTSMQNMMGKEFDLWKKGGFFERYSKTTGRTARIPFSCMQEIQKYNADELSKHIKCKTVLINGDQDTSTPLERTRSFYNKLNCPKELKVIKNCEHIIRTPENLEDLKNYLLEII